MGTRPNLENTQALRSEPCAVGGRRQSQREEGGWRRPVSGVLALQFRARTTARWSTDLEHLST